MADHVEQSGLAAEFPERSDRWSHLLRWASQRNSSPDPIDLDRTERATGGIRLRGASPVDFGWPQYVGVNVDDPVASEQRSAA